MLNMIRADTYRLLRSKGFYITQILMVIVAMISISTSSVGMILGNDSVRQFQTVGNQLIWTGSTSVRIMSSMASVLIYFLLPLFIMTIGFEFSRKTYKNPLSSGMTRLNFFVSKYVVFLFLTVCQIIFFYGFVFLGCSLKNGVGHITSHFIIKWLQTASLQFVELSAIFAVAVLIVYLFFSTLTAVVTTILFPMIMTLMFALFYKHKWVGNFNFQNNVDSAYFTHYTASGMTQLLIAAFGTILVCLVISYLTFRRRDL